MSSSPTSSSSSETSRGTVPPVAAVRDLVCPVDVLVGHGTITVAQCLNLAPTSVIRLAEAAGENVQISVGGVPLARGKVDVSQDATTIRLTEILPAPGAED